MIPRNYVPIPYPKFKYHAVELPRVVPDEAAEAALGPAWKDHPSACHEQPAPAPSEAPAAETGTSTALDADQAAELYATKPADVLKFVQAANTVASLTASLEAERANPHVPGGRPKVLKGIEARLVALQREEGARA